jgi:protein-disulfide isomerase
MPRRNRNFSRQRSTSNNNFQRNILIVAAVVVVVIVIIAVAASTSTPPGGVDFAARTMGSPTAKVVVEEFADFQCPFCALFNITAEVTLREQYIKTGKVLFVFRNLPIVDGFVSGGTESHLAALAALCAGDQDMFWEYHDLLYKSQSGENQGAFSTPRLESLAVELHLDSVKFDQCLSNQIHADVLNGDIRLANYYKLNGTPTYFVNGREITVSQDFHELFDAIDKAYSS